MESAVLVLNNLSKSFKQQGRDHEILKGITASFEQSSTYAIMGVSGVGKSTLMHLMAGLDRPTSGNVFFNGININQMNDSDRNNFCNKSIGLLFQQPYLINELTVLENVMMPAMIAEVPLKECQDRARELLGAVALLDKSGENPGSLSGGQQQRVALARALCNKPSFLLADEPTGNLDKATGMQIIELLIHLRKAWDMGIIVSTHDHYVADAMDVRFTLQDGMLNKNKGLL